MSVSNKVGLESVFRWLGFYLAFLGNIVVLAAALFAVITDDLPSGIVGLSISYALEVCIWAKVFKAILLLRCRKTVQNDNIRHHLGQRS